MISHSLKSPFSPLFPQQAFNATAVVRHMRKLQLGTSQEGQGPTASHGELLTPAAGGEDQDSVEGYGWSMKRHPDWSGGSASTAKSVLSPCRASGWLLLSRLLCGAGPGNVPQAVPPALGPWIQGQDPLCVRDWGQTAPLLSFNWGYPVPPNPTPPLFLPLPHCIFHTNVSILLFLLVIKGRG